MDLDGLSRTQRGVITRAQAREAGLSLAAVRWRLERGIWKPVHPGVYQTHTGKLDWWGRASAALLHYGDDAALAMHSAAFVLGLDKKEPAVLHVHVPMGLKKKPRPGIRVRRRRSPMRTLKRKRLTVTDVVCTVLDIGDDPLSSREDAIAIAARAVQRGKTTAVELAAALAARRTHQHRQALSLSLGVIADGAESVLEVDFVGRVLKAHGLPMMRMAVPDQAAGRAIRRDFVDEEHGVVVEVDGRLAHQDLRGADIRRDRASAGQGKITLRAEWVDVYNGACQLAADIFATRCARGYRGELKDCGAACAAHRHLRRSA